MIALMSIAAFGQTVVAHEDVVGGKLLDELCEFGQFIHGGCNSSRGEIIPDILFDGTHVAGERHHLFQCEDWVMLLKFELASEYNFLLVSCQTGISHFEHLLQFPLIDCGVLPRAKTP